MAANVLTLSMRISVSISAVFYYFSSLKFELQRSNYEESMLLKNIVRTRSSHSTTTRQKNGDDITVPSSHPGSNHILRASQDVLASHSHVHTPYSSRNMLSSGLPPMVHENEVPTSLGVPHVVSKRVTGAHTSDDLMQQRFQDS